MEWADAVGAFERALQRFREVLAEPETTVVRDAAIKRFEFTFELAWKSTQRFLRAQGIACRSPKQCLQEAFAFGLVQDNPLWIRMLEDRNLTVHTYDDRTAQKIYNNLNDYVPLYEQLQRGLYLRRCVWRRLRGASIGSGAMTLWTHDARSRNPFIRREENSGAERSSGGPLRTSFASSLKDPVLQTTAVLTGRQPGDKIDARNRHHLISSWP